MKVFLDEIRINTKTNKAVKNPTTYVPNSKYQIPKNDKNTKPITLYNCSNITIGTVLLLGIPNFVFSSWDFIKSPIFPGITDNAKLEKKITKLSFFGIKILEFFNSKCHLANSINQPDVTSEIIIGKNSILKLEIFSDILLTSDAIRNAA